MLMRHIRSHRPRHLSSPDEILLESLYQHATAISNANIGWSWSQPWLSQSLWF